MTGSNDKNSDNSKREYMGSKYSQQLFPTAKLEDHENKAEAKVTEKNKEQFWSVYQSQSEYSKKKTLSDKDRDLNLNKSISIVEYIKPRNIRRRRNNLTNLTPDEIELINHMKKVH